MKGAASALGDSLIEWTDTALSFAMQAYIAYVWLDALRSRSLALRPRLRDASRVLKRTPAAAMRLVMWPLEMARRGAMLVLFGSEAQGIMAAPAARRARRPPMRHRPVEMIEDEGQEEVVDGGAPAQEPRPAPRGKRAQAAAAADAGGARQRRRPSGGVSPSPPARGRRLGGAGTTLVDG